MSRPVRVGRIAGVYGVKGWVRVDSYTQPAANILNYQPWLIGSAGQQKEYRFTDGRPHGRAVVAHIEGVDDRDLARDLTGAEIWVWRAQFARAESGQYYWSDLVGLQVVNEADEVLGVIDHLFATGANDVMVVQGERRRLLPYITGTVVRKVDLQGGVMRVDWDPDF
jgi:16S rRNA processing protein RimM